MVITLATPDLSCELSLEAKDMEFSMIFKGLTRLHPHPYHADFPTFGSRDGDSSKKKIPRVPLMHIAFSKKYSFFFLF